MFGRPHDISPNGITPVTDSGNAGEQIDRLFAPWHRLDSPGYAVAVVRDGAVVYQRGYGMADFEHDVPITPTSVFDIGSTSKQFTAACVLLLANQGWLSLSDELSKYIPATGIYTTPITIRHLLDHTSGIRDYLTLMVLAGLSTRNDYPDLQIIDLITRQRELNFRPGDEQLYGNSGYFLLSAVVEMVSGQSLRVFAAENVFKPLGMNDTHFHDDLSQLVRNRVIGYYTRPDGSHGINMSFLRAVGDGGVFTTVGDLARWDLNFYENRLPGGLELIEQMTRPGTLNSGLQTTYAHGLFTGSYKGLRTWSHSGGWTGYKAQIVRFPDQRFTVICLANFSSADPTRMALRVSELFLSDLFEKGKSEEKGGNGKEDHDKSRDTVVATTVADLENKMGLYRDPRTNITGRVDFKDGKLIVEGAGIRSELVPITAHRFRPVAIRGNVEVVFSSTQGVRPTMSIIIPGADTIVFEPVREALIEPTNLSDFDGDYFSDELRVTYHISLENQRLMVMVGEQPFKIPAEPLLHDEFTARGGVLKFRRNHQNQVSAFTLNIGRISNILFVRAASPGLVIIR